MAKEKKEQIKADIALQTQAKDDSKEVNALRKQMQDYADSKGFVLNPNEKPLLGVLRGLLRNKQFKGDIYCPCRMVTGDKEKDKEIACPCVFHRGEIELQGKCKCTLFWDPQKTESK